MRRGRTTWQLLFPVSTQCRNLIFESHMSYIAATSLGASAPHSVTIAERVSPSDILIPKPRRQEHPQSTKEMMVTVSKSSKTHIYQATKSRPDLHKPGTGTTPVSPYFREARTLTFLLSTNRKSCIWKEPAHDLGSSKQSSRNITEGPAVFCDFIHTFIHRT